MVPALLPQDFKEFLQLLNEEEVEYLLVGGWAVGIHGYPRYTGDMDVWFAMDEANARKAVHALERFGFSHGEVSLELLMDVGKIIRIGFPPIRIELMNQIDGVQFADCYARRLLVEMNGVEVPVIAFHDLIANKRASKRAKDLADVEELTGGG